MASEPIERDDLWTQAITQIRDALATLSYASDGHFEEEAQVALDALDWIEAHYATA